MNKTQMDNPDIWVPEHERDARYYIWKVRYRVSIPYNQFFSIGQLRTLGLPSSGDSAMDRAISKSPEVKMMSINEMFEYWRAGVAPSIVNPKDCVKIYEAIQGYQNAWKIELIKILRVEDAPIDDLMALDDFAAAIYDKAKYNFPKAEVDSILARRMGSILQFNRGNILIDRPKVNKDEPKKEEKEVDPYPQRASDKDYFASFQRATASAKPK